MDITRRSPLTGATHTKDIAITKEQLEKWYYDGQLIQDVAPDLSDDDREFIISGITPEEWDEYFNLNEG